MIFYLFGSFLCFAGLALAQECGKDFGDRHPKENIETVLKQYPSIGSINYVNAKGEEFSIGKGILISPRFVLSSAVNFIQVGIKPTIVRLGDHNLLTVEDCSPSDPKDCADAALNYEIDRVILHPQYDAERLTNDIALVRLKPDVIYSEYIQPICLPDVNVAIKDDENLYFCTYSKIGTKSTEITGVRRTVVLPVRNSEECMANLTAMYPQLKFDNADGVICAGAEGRDSCYGDSGAALMRPDPRGRWMALGLLSFGPAECGRGEVPSVYTRISTYLDWIRDIVSSDENSIF